MRLVPCTILCFLITQVFSHSSAAEVSDSDLADRFTHQQSGVIEIDDADDASDQKINAFCLNHEGHIVAVCGTGPGEVRVSNDEGEILHSWAVDVKPESVGVSDDDSVLVGGEGKLFRFTATGDLVVETESPHAARLRSSTNELREAAVASIKSRRRSRMTLPMAKSRLRSFEEMMEKLKERQEDKELNESEERMLKVLPALLERYQKQAADLEAEAEKKAKAAEDAEDGEEEKSEPEISESEIEQKVESMIRSKMRVSSISSRGEFVFVTTRAIEGYGYDVWKMNLDFDDAEVVVSDLRGCCGQMDVQCSDNGLFVAENSRDRVVHFDVDGKEINHWGKSDRAGVDGFASCCNPMNLCFDQEGFVYTAEASIGRIKKFDPSGELVSFVGDVELVPGCKNVSIAVSPVSEKIYMLDLTRNHIKVMEPKQDEKPVTEPEQEDDLIVTNEAMVDSQKDDTKADEAKVNAPVADQPSKNELEDAK
ncbi:hypothetical protein LF1_19980 [Rubripirellula obstinata]|uniref:SMP-30/Gluconolaconase/LRE-like region n=1 Tax=Rubripirellula obstinata TaxID=406547 RepID=A0A5B1CJI5_9BACT|nr:hypothetical protein [Rubripirellula obstinata]KAA1259464.1 hypothetical protein LF1_19980 [Rubripirellula obstinata]